MATRLTATRFSKALHEQVRNFECGELLYQKPLALWIKDYSLTALQNRTKIWLYTTNDQKGDLVGYGSLGKTPIVLASEEGIAQEEVKIACIPTLAIQTPFHGKPDDAASKEDRFSTQIVRHLQSEAREGLKGSSLKPLLLLYVHPDNEADRKVYLRCGFEPFPLTKYDAATGAEGQAMIYDLRKAN